MSNLGLKAVCMKSLLLFERCTAGQPPYCKKMDTSKEQIIFVSEICFLVPTAFCTASRNSVNLILPALYRSGHVFLSGKVSRRPFYLRIRSPSKGITRMGSIQIRPLHHVTREGLIVTQAVCWKDARNIASVRTGIERGMMRKRIQSNSIRVPEFKVSRCVGWSFFVYFCRDKKAATQDMPHCPSLHRGC